MAEQHLSFKGSPNYDIIRADVRKYKAMMEEIDSHQDLAKYIYERVFHRDHLNSVDENDILAMDRGALINYFNEEDHMWASPRRFRKLEKSLDNDLEGTRQFLSEMHRDYKTHDVELTEDRWNHHF